MSKVLEAVDHLKQANPETTGGCSERSIKPKPQIKTEQDAEFMSVREKVNQSLLKVKVIIDQTDPMPLLQAVAFLDSDIGSTTTEEPETNTADDTNNSSMIEQLMPRRSKTRAKKSITDQAMNTQEESSDVATVASSQGKKRSKFQEVSSEPYMIFSINLIVGWRVLMKRLWNASDLWTRKEKG